MVAVAAAAAAVATTTTTILYPQFGSILYACIYETIVIMTHCCCQQTILGVSYPRKPARKQHTYSRNHDTQYYYYILNGAAQDTWSKKLGRPGQHPEKGLTDWPALSSSILLDHHIIGLDSYNIIYSSIISMNHHWPGGSLCL